MEFLKEKDQLILEKKISTSFSRSEKGFKKQTKCEELIGQK